MNKILRKAVVFIVKTIVVEVAMHYAIKKVKNKFKGK